MSDTVVFGLLTLVAWVFWALFTANVAAELAAALGRGTRWRPPPAGPLQASAHRLVMAIMMTATLTGPLGQRGGAAPRLDPAPVAAVTMDAHSRPAGAGGRCGQVMVDPVATTTVETRTAQEAVASPGDPVGDVALARLAPLRPGGLALAHDEAMLTPGFLGAHLDPGDVRQRWS